MNMRNITPLVIIALCAFALIVNTAWAQEESDKPIPDYKFPSMAIAVGLASIGAGFSVAKVGSAATASITEKPELFGRTIVYVGMAEGIAIYGLLIAFLIWI